MLRQYPTVFAVSIIWACLVATLAAAEKPVEGPIGAFLGEPRMEVQPLFKVVRHPNIVVTLKSDWCGKTLPIFRPFRGTPWYGERRLDLHVL